MTSSRPMRMTRESNRASSIATRSCRYQTANYWLLLAHKQVARDGAFPGGGYLPRHSAGSWLFLGWFGLFFPALGQRIDPGLLQLRRLCRLRDIGGDRDQNL